MSRVPLDPSDLRGDRRGSARRLVSEGRGEDSRLGSRVEVRTQLELSPAGEGATAVSYASDVTVLGRLGSIGDAVMKVKARELAGLFAQKVTAALESKPTGEGG